MHLFYIGTALAITAAMAAPSPEDNTMAELPQAQACLPASCISRGVSKDYNDKVRQDNNTLSTVLLW